MKSKRFTKTHTMKFSHDPSVLCLHFVQCSRNKKKRGNDYRSSSCPYQTLFFCTLLFSNRVSYATKEQQREKKSASWSKWLVITAKYVGQRCCWTLDWAPRVSSSSSGPMRKFQAPLGVKAMWALLQTQAPGLDWSLENWTLLSQGSTLEELQTPPPRPATGLCSEWSYHTHTHTHSRSDHGRLCGSWFFSLLFFGGIN